MVERSSLVICQGERSASAGIASKDDERANNRGNSLRQAHSSRGKDNFVEGVNEAMDEDSNLTVTQSFKEVLKCTGAVELKRLRNRSYQWYKDDRHEACLRDLLGTKKIIKGKSGRRKGQSHSPYDEIETNLYRQFTDQRKKGRKVSASWIQITAKKIFNQEKVAIPG